MAQHLIVILDAIKSHWEIHENALIDARSQSITVSLIISSIKSFESALKLLNSENTLSLYISIGNTQVKSPPASVKLVRGSIWKASSMALCKINSQKSKSRLLIIQKSSDPNEQEIALNLMIAAQQLKVEIDGLGLSECEVLEKTSAFTGGVFLRQSNTGVLQTLLQVYLPATRPRANLVHFKPYCNCCRKQVERAYVCSNCLAIYCVFQPICNACNSRLLVR